VSVIEPLDRIYAVAASNGEPWTLRSNGHGGVFTPGAPASPRAATAATATDSMKDLLAQCLAPEGAPTSYVQFAAFVTVPCARCKGERSRRCPDCGGTGRELRECDHCDDTHDCCCGECNEGRVACACAKLSPRRVEGRAFDAHLIATVLAEMPREPLRLAVLGDASRAILALKSFAAIGVVMGVNEGAVPLVDAAPVWSPVAEEPST